ncbi:MAG TPA: hypothetical protein PL054_06900 [Clostridia bacterium]|nr:MAG: hypothetical protein BWX97_01887 [Firmicutes bacterium ADurb.Bin146]HOD93584.1 hypothetical protein [Clostridia bacterium]
MIRCKKCKKLINEYLNQNKPDEIKQILDIHLDNCMSCKEYYYSVLSVNTMLKGLKKEYSINIKNAVLEKISEEQPKSIINKKIYIRYAAAIACMAIAIGVYIFTQGFNKVNMKEGLAAQTQEITGDQKEYLTFGITTNNDSESADRSFSSSNTINYDNLIVYNYVTDKNYDEIIKDIDIVSDEFLIIEVYTQAENNEISFISCNSNMQKLVQELNLKEDIKSKNDESIVSDSVEYIKFVIIYSD